MIEEEKDVSFRLAKAHMINLEVTANHGLIFDAFVAGRESKTEMVVKEINRDYFKMFQSERDRAAKLEQSLMDIIEEVGACYDRGVSYVLLSLCDEALKFLEPDDD